MAKFLGNVVLARAPGERLYREVCPPFETKAGAEAFMAMYLRQYPGADCYVSIKLRREQGRD